MLEHGYNKAHISLTSRTLGESIESLTVGEKIDGIENIGNSNLHFPQMKC